MEPRNRSVTAKGELSTLTRAKLFFDVGSEAKTVVDPAAAGSPEAGMTFLL